MHKWLLAFLLATLGCSSTTAAGDPVHSVLLTNPQQESYSGIVVSKPTESFRVEFTVPPGLHACVLFHDSQLRADSLIVVASYFASDITHPVGDTLSARANWTWDGLTATPAPAC